MGQEYPMEIREEAAGLYVEGGMTYEQVAAETGVSKSQIVRWAEAGKWRERKAEYRSAISGIRRDTVRLRQALVGKAMESLDPQDVYALARIESIAEKRTAAQPDRPAPVSEPKAFDTPADAIAALWDAINLRVNEMLHVPTGPTLADLKRLKESFDYLDQMKSRFAAASDTPDKKGLTDETRDRIRRVMGIP